jgi:hypothetical protein
VERAVTLGEQGDQEDAGAQEARVSSGSVIGIWVLRHQSHRVEDSLDDD